MKLRFPRSTLHARAELVIPWLANGTLAQDAEPLVRQHIATCPECRADYEEQLRVGQTMRTEGPLVFAAESSYQKLLTRIQKTEADGELPRPTAEPYPCPAIHGIGHARPVVRWLAAAAILQAFAIGLGAWMWHSSGTVVNSARYVTLTSESPSYDSGPRVRVLFRTDLTVGALQTVLQGAGARIIDGPADGNVYTLGFAPPLRSAGALEKRIVSLRANPAILFAQPVQADVH